MPRAARREVATALSSDAIPSAAQTPSATTTTAARRAALLSPRPRACPTRVAPAMEAPMGSLKHTASTVCGGRMGGMTGGRDIHMTCTTCACAYVCACACAQPYLHIPIVRCKFQELNMHFK
eukprot:scaffold37672_cov76-Phaeocystis_antarctica.AAC.3